MTPLALTLVLISAVLHATWNLFAKRAGGGVAFVWLANGIALLALVPIVAVLFVLDKPHIGPLEIGMMLGSSILQVAYFIALLRGYRLGDFSLVYPLARGTAPLLTALAAIVLFAERPTPLAILGAGLIAGGAFLLTGGPKALRRTGATQAALYGILTGVIISSYTLWDKFAVSELAIPPLLLFFGLTLGQVAILTPVVLGRSGELRAEWRTHKPALFAVGLLSPISYILVLYALTLSPVSYVAPAREISILLGTFLGTRVLAEGDAVRRLAASSAMVIGIMALALG
jgi:drug/metabolite transporter (DMT)-like permease